MDPALVKVDETGNFFCFQANFQVLLPTKEQASSSSAQQEGEEADEEEEEDELQNPLILVSKDPVSSVKGEFVHKTTDFMLVGSNTTLQKGYYVRFVHPVFPSKLVLWNGYINLSKPQVTMAGGFGLLLPLC